MRRVTKADVLQVAHKIESSAQGGVSTEFVVFAFVAVLTSGIKLDGVTLCDLGSGAGDFVVPWIKACNRFGVNKARAVGVEVFPHVHDVARQQAIE